MEPSKKTETFIGFYISSYKVSIIFRILTSSVIFSFSKLSLYNIWKHFILVSNIFFLVWRQTCDQIGHTTSAAAKLKKRKKLSSTSYVNAYLTCRKLQLYQRTKNSGSQQNITALPLLLNLLLIFFNFLVPRVGVSKRRNSANWARMAVSQTRQSNFVSESFLCCR